ncbi:MAG: tetratricopeptide repeat-containing sulfotransferase family protein [Steroidobacteraceae bacterium]
MTRAGAAVDIKLVRVASLLDSDPRAAAREAEQVLQEHPGHPVATLLLGTARRSFGDPGAQAAFEQLAAAQPHSPLVQLELGRTFVAQGRDTEGLAALTRAVELSPNLAEAWRDLSAVLASRGDTKGCDVAFAHYSRLAAPERRLSEAAAALATFRLDAAEALLRRHLGQEPQDAVALRMLARVAAEREDFIEAERLLAQCLQLAPGYSAARFDLARLLHGQQKAHPMLLLLERLLALEPDKLEYLSLQASAYSLLGHNERAIAILSSLLAKNPQDELVWLSYGHALRLAGRFTEAVKAYRKSAELRSDFGEAWFGLANLKTFRFTPADIDAMGAHVARADLNDHDRLQFEFALGKALEDAADYHASFQHYTRGNALRRAMVQYDGGGNTRLVQRSITLYTREFLAARAGFGCPAADPIFIVGMPRSGSTLIEQILASHSQIEGTRELPDFPGFALELGVRETPGQPPAYPQSVARLSRKELAALGERYLAQTRPHRLRGAPHFIDKMPSNFFHLGLIQLTLPNARIIDARRSPLGCCFSNFKQHFQSGVWFSYDLGDIGLYYRDYVRLMAHFDTALPGRVHRVYYENLVADLETEVRKLLEYCGLPFEEQCLRFHETRRVVQTASSEQVRRPLYAQGVDQWRHYEPWLGRLKEALGDTVEHYPAAARAGSRGASAGSSGG